MFREYSYIHATPHNRASFVRLFWKCYRQIGKKGGICYFRFTPFYFSWSRQHITVVSVFIFKPDKDRREIFILLLLILSKKNIFFHFILHFSPYPEMEIKPLMQRILISLTTDFWLKCFVKKGLILS